MSNQYLITFYTGDNGTDDDVSLTLYDMNGKIIGNAFEVSEKLSDKYGDALEGDTTQMEIYTPPMLQSNKGRIPAFLNVEIRGSDQWFCKEIHVDLYPPQSSTETAVFTLNQNFSTDSDEGVTSVQVARNDYKIDEIENSHKVRNITTFAIGNNADAESNPSPLPKKTLKEVIGDTISVTESKGSEHDRSVSIGIKSGFNIEGVSGEVSTAYTEMWKNWATNTNMSLYSKEKSETTVIGGIEGLAKTVRIARWDINYKVNLKTVSNGLGEDPVAFNMIPNQTIMIPSVKTIDINESNKISQKDWADLMKQMKESYSVADDLIEITNETLNKKGWITN